MLLSHYLPKILTALFGGLFIFAGIYTFGEPLLFDRLFICILVFTAVVCRKNVNVLGVVVILVIQRLVEETAWSISELEYKDVIKTVFYFIAITVYWKVKYDKLSRMLLLALVFALAAEFFWIFKGIKAPEIYWYVGLLASYSFARHMIFMRVSYTEDFFPKQAASINLDWNIFKINAFFGLMQLLMVCEYIIRSALGFKGITFVYYSYPYIIQLFSTFVVWSIFHESYKLLLPKLLKA